MGKELTIRLLGGFSASLGDAPLDIKSRKSQALLAALALAEGAGLARDDLATLLWSDRGSQQARSSLRQALADLRRAFGEQGAGLLKTERDVICLEAAKLQCDALALRRLSESNQIQDLEPVAALYGGELLAGIGVTDPAFEEWLEGERNRLQAAYQGALLKLLDLQSRNDSAAAIATARKLLVLDPLQESVHRSLMQLYAQSGDRALALK